MDVLGKVQVGVSCVFWGYRSWVNAWFVSWFAVVDFTYILGSRSGMVRGEGGGRSCVFGVCVGLGCVWGEGVWGSSTFCLTLL